MRKALYILAIVLFLSGCGTKQHEATDESLQEPTVLDKESIKSITDAMNAGDLQKVKDISGKLGINARTESGKTLLHMAVENAPSKIVEFLIAEGADVNARTSRGWTPLHMIDIPSQPSPRIVDIEAMKKKARLLLKAGADANAKDGRFGWTPLHHLAWFGGDRESAEIFISGGANVNAVDPDGLTPLDFAVDIKHDTMAEGLREHGGELGDPLRFEMLNAAEKGHKDVVKFLIASGMRVDAEGLGCMTPLFVAANAEIAQVLISNGSDVNAKSKCYPPTPIFSAIDHKRKDVVKLLLSQGAWVNESNSWGKTPLDMAKSEEMKQLLRSHGAVSGKGLQKEDK